ncbi:MAG TPA: phenylalanine--tRNA ligase subunit alpha [Vicinamibacterales bacterium]|nr:phenylalanine--tRNA ligase subunit alpha [Vicinamibacterales bacterium]
MPDAAAIDRLRAEFEAALAEASSGEALRALRDRYLGRKGGVVASLMKSVAAAPAADRPLLGRLANELKREVETRIDQARAALEASRPVAGAVDVTLPGRPVALGRLHPVTIVRQQVESIFGRMGFEILEGPELEDDYHNFEALNMPPEHPARDMQDTLFLARPVPQNAPAIPGSRPSRGRPLERRPATLLRTHTSGMQIRYMEAHPPPVRVVAIGKVFRRDNPDLTHTPMFHQFEGLLVDEGVTLADLKGTLTAFVREIFSPDTRVLFRPSFFPYTEPSAEVFIGCVFCAGAGCPVCKRTGWLEILGSGMVHPAVLEAVGYDPERYTGFAFGTGIERVAMLKYRVGDLRLFYENDLRFLEQFSL